MSKTRFRSLVAIVLGVMVSLFAGAQTGAGYIAMLKVEHVSIKSDSSTMCIVVGEDGQYHLEVWPDDTKVYQDRTRVSTGYLPSEELHVLQALIDSRALRAEGSVTELIRPDKGKLANELQFTKDGYVVLLSLRRNAGPQELRVSDAENGNAIPDSVRAFIPWLGSLRQLSEGMIKDAEPNGCQALEATPDFLPRLKTRPSITKDVGLE